MTTTLYFNEEDGIKALLIGRTVAKVSDDTISLDDGTTLTIVPNEGCGGCPSGEYHLEELNDCPNMIMAVEFEDDNSDDGSGWSDDAHTYRIFVYAANQKIKLLEVAGDDGNGYYGTGYWINVTRSPFGARR